MHSAEKELDCGYVNLISKALSLWLNSGKYGMKIRWLLNEKESIVI